VSSVSLPVVLGYAKALLNLSMILGLVNELDLVWKVSSRILGRSGGDTGTITPSEWIQMAYIKQRLNLDANELQDEWVLRITLSRADIAYH
jgi:hypothetical protein